MDYQEFLNKVTEELKVFLPEKYSEAEISIQQVDKLQGLSYKGIAVKLPDSDIGLTMNIVEAFDNVNVGIPYQVVMAKLAAEVEKGLDNMPNISYPDLTDYSSLKEHLMINLVPMKENLDMLMAVPYRQVHDMAMVYRVVLGSNERGSSTILFTNKMCNSFGISPTQLHEDAMINSQEKFPYKIRDMREVLADMMGMDFEPTEDEKGDLFVATCNGGVNGAACICYEAFMREAAEKLNGDFYVLPSSIHEVVLVPDVGKGDYKVLEKMVQEINETEVNPEDRLSNKVYHYDSVREVFERAENFAKMQQKEPAERCSR